MVEVRQCGADELHAVLVREVAEGVVGREEHAVLLRNCGHGIAGPLVEVLQLVGVLLAGGGEGVLGLRGGLGQRVDDVVDLNLGLLRGGPHVRVVLEFWGLAVLPRERPRARVHVLDALVDGVLAVAIAHAFALDARGYGHDAVEAGGVHGLVEEVLEVDSVDEHVVGLGERLHLLWGHLVLVGAGVRGEQTGEVEGHWALAGGGLCTLGVDLVELDAAGGYLGEVVADLGSRGHGLDGVAVLRFCGVGGFFRGAASGEAGAEC